MVEALVWLAIGFCIGAFVVDMKWTEDAAKRDTQDRMEQLRIFYLNEVGREPEYRNDKLVTDWATFQEEKRMRESSR